MADSKVVDLPAASTLTGSELVYGVQGSADVKITPAQLATLIGGNIDGGLANSTYGDSIAINGGTA